MSFSSSKRRSASGWCVLSVAGMLAANACDRPAPTICPKVSQHWADLEAQLFRPSCGGRAGPSCHGPDNAAHLDLDTNPLAALLGPDGLGAPASNIDGSAKGLRRVVPSVPEASFLLTKLQLAGPADARYGRGMPLGREGAVCVPVLRRVSEWIESGSPR